MKKTKMHTRILLSFAVLDIFAIFDIVLGYFAAMDILKADDPTYKILNYRITTASEIIFFVVLAGIIAISISRSIRISLKNLSDITKAVAQGDVNYAFSKKRDDEFGKVIDDMQVMVNTIRYQSDVAQKVADGDLTVNVISKGPQDVMSNSLKSMVERNSHAIGNVSDAAYQVMTSSSQVASASEALAQGSTEQASAIEQITASISEIAEKTKQNASEANEAAKLVNKAITDVKAGNEQMKDMMDAMEAINSSSESISKIMKVIDDIAFQTNILALNAAVEAARAGDAGKGFAVVAEEVRNLAAKSASAAAETAELIEDSIRKVSSGSKIAGDTYSALETITEHVTQSEVLIGNIAESSNYQATAVAQINQAIGQVSQVVQTNSATSEQCAAASEELSNQAIRMRDLLSIYNLGDRNFGEENASVECEDDKGNDVVSNEQIISLEDSFGKY